MSFMNTKWLSFIFFFSSIVSAKPTINLRSVFHHTGALRTSNQIELGTLILFFTQPTLPTLLQKKNSATADTFTFLFPATEITNLQALIDRANQAKGDGYSLYLSYTLHPKKGLLLSIEYDPRIVAFQYESIIGNNANPGYLFRFINKKVTNDLKKNVT